MHSTHFRRDAKLAAALLTLRKRVHDGQELAEACAKTALSCNVDHDKLRQAYLDACAELARDAKRWFNTMGVGQLHRAYVSLPAHLTEAERPLQERVVFFEAPAGVKPWQHLEALLRAAWCEDTTDWCERGFVYNVTSARELFDEGASCSEPPARIHGYDLRLFECGWGGRDGIGAEHIHYSRTVDIDLFVTPRVAARLQIAMAEIEGLYAAEPARRAAATAEVAR